MLVKIGNNVYDSRKTPVMLMLDGQDKAALQSLKPKQFRYISAPSLSEEALEKWARLDESMTKVASETKRPWTWKIASERSDARYELYREGVFITSVDSAEAASRLSLELNAGIG